MAEVNATQMRDALAWVTNDSDKAKEPSTNPFVWFWEAVQGDFNESRSAAQIMTDAAISMIPLVDQVCDVRDLIANCRKIKQDPADTWAWVSLVLSLIGLFPSLGSLVKGVLKIFFNFVRRAGGDAIAKGATAVAKGGSAIVAHEVDLAMTWVITYLRRRDVQRYLQVLKVDEVFSWLAIQIKAVKGRVNVGALTAAFDSGIQIMEAMVNKVSAIPYVYKKAKGALQEVKEIRLMADAKIAAVLKPTIDALDTIILRLEREAIATRHGILNANNVHFQGALPEAAAVTLMRRAEPLPVWLSMGEKLEWGGLQYNSKIQKFLEDKVEDGYPKLTKGNVESFHKLVADKIEGPARLYRILAPNSRAMSDCWVTEEVFKKLQAASDPRAAWRKNLAVWPHWNVNGQFVTYDVKPGEVLKVFRGPTSSQIEKELKGRHLEGGWEQIVFTVERTDARNDTVRYYQLKGGRSNQLRNSISAAEYEKLSKDAKAQYTGIREAINHPNISGPFETGWGYTDFGGAGFLDKVGLPTLPGQTTQLSK
jgi:hypothetical protein